MLDRNGLRPARYLITKNDMMLVASEVGVMDFEANEIKEKGRLQPGKILMVDTEKGEIYYDGELKKQLAEAKPYKRAGRRPLRSSIPPANRPSLKSRAAGPSQGSINME